MRDDDVGSLGAGDIGKGGFWWGTWHPMFWTCPCDVILGLGREGATYESWKISGRKFVYRLRIMSTSGIIICMLNVQVHVS